MKFHEDGSLPLNNEIFVFGSNLAGIHGVGAAKIAYHQFGAIYYHGIGLMGQSYAIPTKSKQIQKISFNEIEKYINNFVKFTMNHPNLNFFVTRIGCGLADYKDEYIAPLFTKAQNCSFANNWKPFLVNYI
jgi:hypothetical protein